MATQVRAQIKESVGGFKPTKGLVRMEFEGKKITQPSAICLTTSAFQGFRLGKYMVIN